MIRKTALVLLAVLLVAGAAFAGGQSEAGEVQTMRLATNHPEGTPASLGYELFADRVEELTDGAIEVEIFYSSVLGDSREVMEQVQAGAIEMTHISAGFVASFVPVVDVFNVPYLFRSHDHYWNVLNGSVGQEIIDDIDDTGVKHLYWVEGGSRSFFNNIRPIESPEDLQGMRIRVMGSPVMLETMELLGATPTTTAYAEVYNALQTGVIDGAENSAISITSMKFNEVSDYYSLNEHQKVPDMLLMNKDIFDGLPADQQEAIMQAADDAEMFTREEWIRQEDEAMDIIRDTGVQINEIEDKTPFIEATAPLHDKVNADFDGIVDKIKAVDG
jgi:tripartite ATP-independent transporter DctP family solute receptor